MKTEKSLNSARNWNSSVKKGRVSSEVPMRMAAVRAATRAKILRRKSRQKTVLFHPPLTFLEENKRAERARGAALAAGGAGGGGGRVAEVVSLVWVSPPSTLTTVAEEPSAAAIATPM